MKPHKRKGRAAKRRRQESAKVRAEMNNPNTKLLKEIFSKKEN